jgi:hypothetical protein
MNGLRQSYDAAPISSRRPEPVKEMTNEEFIKKLQLMIPHNVFLPNNPIVLSEQDEVTVHSVTY